MFETDTQAENTGKTNGRQRPKADGFLNLAVVGKDDKRISVPSQAGTIALHANTKFGRTLLAAAKEDPEREFMIVGKVHIVDENDDSVYEL